MIGLLDSLLVVFVILGVIIGFTVLIVKAIFARNLGKVFLGAIVCGAVFAGMVVGNKMLMAQFYSATEYVEKLAIEINTIREKEGTFPDNLSGISYYDSSGFVPVGIFRKRPLHYFIQEKKVGFVMGFPFDIWMIANYDSISGTWEVDD